MLYSFITAVVQNSLCCTSAGDIYIDLFILAGRIDRSQYWIGFNDMLSQMRFMWSDGSPIHYTNWAENEPNNWLNRNEDCVGIFLKVCM